MEKEDSYADFQSLAYWEGVVSPIKLLQTHSFIDFFQYMYVMVIVVFLAWIKLFKYISFNTTMNQVSRAVVANNVSFIKL